MIFGDWLRPETLILVLFFVVPGFVVIRAFDLVIPSERRTLDNSFIDMLAYSFLVLAIWGLPFLGLISLGRWLPGFIYYLLLYLFTIFVVFIFPIYMTWVYYKARTEWPLQGRTIHPSPTSWDYLFDQGEIFWIRFYFKSGERLGGFYGENSFATSFPNTQQIYIEQLYSLNDDGSFSEPVNRSSGAIVKLDDCQYIEFLEVKEDSNDQIYRIPEQTSLLRKALRLSGLDKALVFILGIIIKYVQILKAGRR